MITERQTAEAAVLMYGVERGPMNTGMVRDAAALTTRQDARRLIGRMLDAGLIAEHPYRPDVEVYAPGMYDVTTAGRAALEQAVIA